MLRRLRHRVLWRLLQQEGRRVGHPPLHLIFRTYELLRFPITTIPVSDMQKRWEGTLSVLPGRYGTLFSPEYLKREMSPTTSPEVEPEKNSSNSSRLVPPCWMCHPKSDYFDPVLCSSPMLPQSCRQKQSGSGQDESPSAKSQS